MAEQRAAWPWWQRGLWAGACIAACWFFGPQFVEALRPPRTLILDFFQEWASARNRLDGLPVYGDQVEAARRYLGYERRPGEFFLERNAHPPPSVLLVLPLAWLDYPDAFLAWDLLSLACLAASGWLVVRQLGIRFTLWSLLPIVTLLLVCNPFIQQMNQGQLNLVLLLLLTGAWTAERSGHPFAAGALVGVATAIKLFPAFLFLYFGFQRQWTAVAAGVASLIGINALTAVVLGPDAYRGYVQEALPAVSVYRDWWPNVSLPGFWSKLFDGSSGHVVPVWHSPALAQALAAVSVLGLAVGVGWLTSRARSLQARDHAFALTLTAMLLASPITWDHYFMLLLLPLVLLWRDLRPRAERAAFWVVVVLLGLWPMIYWAPLTGATMQNWMKVVAVPWQTLTALAVQTYALLGLLALGVIVLRRMTGPKVPAAPQG